MKKYWKLITLIIILSNNKPNPSLRQNDLQVAPSKWKFAHVVSHTDGNVQCDKKVDEGLYHTMDHEKAMNRSKKILI